MTLPAPSKALGALSWNSHEETCAPNNMMNSVLTRSEADAILGKYHPRAVIPAHYYVTGLMTAVSGLESANGWVNDQEKVHHADVQVRCPRRDDGPLRGALARD